MAQRIGMLAPWELEDPNNLSLSDAFMLPEFIAGGRAPAGARPSPTMVAPELPALPAVQKQAFGSGMSQEAKGTLNQENKGVTQTNQYMTPEEMRARVEALSGLEPIRAQQAQLDRNRRLLEQELGRPVAVDYATPLANLADYWTTGRLGNRASPQNTEAAMNRIRDWAKSIQDDQRDLSSTILRGLQAGKTGTEMDQWRTLLGLASETRSVDPAKSMPKPSAAQLRTPENFWKDYQRSVKDLQNSNVAARNALSTLDINNTVSYNAALNFLARASGEKGPLSESDLARFSGDPSVQARVERAWSKLREGKPLEVDRRDLKTLADGYLRFSEGEIARVKDRYTNHVAPNVYGIQPKAAAGMLREPERKEAPKQQGPDIKGMLQQIMKDMK